MLTERAVCAGAAAEAIRRARPSAIAQAAVRGKAVIVGDLRTDFSARILLLVSDAPDLKRPAASPRPAYAKNLGRVSGRGRASAIEFLPAPLRSRSDRRRVPILHAGAADAADRGQALLEGAEQALGDVALVGVLRAPRIPVACRARAHVADQR